MVLRFTHSQHCALRVLTVFALGNYWSKCLDLLDLDFATLAPLMSSCSAHRLYIVMTAQIFELVFLARGKFCKYKTSMDQNSLLQWWSMGKMLFRQQGDFSLQYREWLLGKIGCKAEPGHLKWVTKYIFLLFGAPPAHLCLKRLCLNSPESRGVELSKYPKPVLCEPVPWSQISMLASIFGMNSSFPVSQSWLTFTRDKSTW